MNHAQQLSDELASRQRRAVVAETDAVADALLDQVGHLGCAAYFVLS